MEASLDILRREHEVLDIFCSLASIPSPSLKEEKVIEWILDFCANNNISARKDSYGNVYINIPATDSSKEPLMVSAHMDVVGDSSPVEIYLEDGFLKAKGRTLGADDKVGVACALMLAKELTAEEIPHGGLEVVFTRDEECDMSGVEHVEYNKLKSKYILVCDADKLGQFQISGASYTNAKLTVKGYCKGDYEAGVTTLKPMSGSYTDNYAGTINFVIGYTNNQGAEAEKVFPVTLIEAPRN